MTFEKEKSYRKGRKKMKYIKKTLLAQGFLIWSVDCYLTTTFFFPMI